MTKRINNITQMLDLLDHPKAKFYGKKNTKDLDNISREDVKQMDMKSAQEFIDKGLYVVINR